MTGMAGRNDHDEQTAAQGDEMTRPETDSPGGVRATRAGDPQAAVAGGSSGPAISAASDQEIKAQQIQRGFEPAETILQLVDAIRQDTAGIGACVSSIRFIASARGDDVPKSVLQWVDRLAAHVERLESKCALALNERSS